MTSTIDLSAPTPAFVYDTERPAIDTLVRRLMRSEFRKIFSTRTWLLVCAGLCLGQFGTQLLNYIEAAGAASSDFHGRAAANFTAQFMTAGSYLGGLAVMLLAILLITNEFAHQTASTTFLTVSRRELVIAAKFGAATASALALWAVTTVVNLGVAAWFYLSRGLPAELDSRVVVRAVVLNALVYLLWAVFGIGVGALVRAQVAATVTATLIYTIGTFVIFGIAAILRTSAVHTDGIYTAMVVLPSVAAATVTSSPDTSPFPNQPAWWVCLAVLAGYGLVTGWLGIRILRRLDIS